MFFYDIAVGGTGRVAIGRVSGCGARNTNSNPPTVIFGCGEEAESRKKNRRKTTILRHVGFGMMIIVITIIIYKTRDCRVIAINRLYL